MEVREQRGLVRKRQYEVTNTQRWVEFSSKGMNRGALTTI